MSTKFCKTPARHVLLWTYQDDPGAISALDGSIDFFPSSFSSNSDDFSQWDMPQNFPENVRSTAQETGSNYSPPMFDCPPECRQHAFLNLFRHHKPVFSCPDSHFPS
jgi:hypothetical protein